MVATTSSPKPQTFEEIERHAVKRIKAAIETAPKPKIDIPVLLVPVKNGGKPGFGDLKAVERFMQEHIEGFLGEQAKKVLEEMKRDFPQVKIHFLFSGTPQIGKGSLNVEATASLKEGAGLGEEALKSLPGHVDLEKAIAFNKRHGIDASLVDLLVKVSGEKKLGDLVLAQEKSGFGAFFVLLVHAAQVVLYPGDLKNQDGQLGLTTMGNALLQIGTVNQSEFLKIADKMLKLKSVILNYSGETADPSVISSKTTDIVKFLVKVSGSSSATVSSTKRTPEDQARIFLDVVIKPKFSSNKKDNGLGPVFNQYKISLHPVIKTAQNMLIQNVDKLEKGNKVHSDEEIKNAMRDKLVEMNWSGSHGSDFSIRQVLDITPSSLGNNSLRFRIIAETAKKNGIIAQYFPPGDPKMAEYAHHVDILQ